MSLLTFNTNTKKIVPSFDKVALEKAEMKKVRVDPATLPELPKTLYVMAGGFKTSAKYDDNNKAISGSVSKITVTCRDYDLLASLQEKVGDKALDLTPLLEIQIELPDEGPDYESKINEIKSRVTSLQDLPAFALTGCEVWCGLSYSMTRHGYAGLKLVLGNFMDCKVEK